MHARVVAPPQKTLAHAKATRTTIIAEQKYKLHHQHPLHQSIINPKLKPQVKKIEVKQMLMLIECGKMQETLGCASATIIFFF